MSVSWHRPSAPAVITAAGLLTWAAAAFTYAAISGDQNWEDAGVLLIAASAIGLAALWRAEPGRAQLPRKWKDIDAEWAAVNKELNR